MNSYVTLLANADYVPGVCALARSLTMCQSRWPLTVLVVEDMNGLDDLESLGCRILQVDPLPLSADFRARHSRKSQHTLAPFTKGNKPQFHDPLYNFVKLRLWELEQYEKVVFVDADTLVIQNIDRLFSFPEFVAAPNLYESFTDLDRMNSGVFVASPSRRTYEMMLEQLDRPDVFWSRTDQTFLQSFFPDWYGLPYFYNTLQYVWFNLPQLWDWKRIRLIHYQYEKPWEAENPKRDLLGPVIEAWWHVFEYGQMPLNLPAPLEGELARR